ncbi:hypothetical protein ACFU96_21220 [Streptomyces sp. NPDC057620]
MRPRKRARRAHVPMRSGPGWIATVLEGALDALLNFLISSWGRR